MRVTFSCWLFPLLGLLSAQALAESDEQVAATVIALAKAQWAADMNNESTAKLMATVADEYTEFNPDSPVRLDGKDLNMRLAEATRREGSQLVAAEMANEHVQVYGVVAILSYNFVGMLQTIDGEVEPFFAKSTRVYAKKGRDWQLVHANFAPVTTGG